ncbi:hypothetical protein Tco_0561741 [Tanacetum coccineum]
MKQNEVSADAFRLSLFPYSLTHHAIAWYDRLTRNSIHSFDEMMRKFLSKYFPPSMILQQLFDEPVHQVNVIDVACEEYAQEVLGFLDSSTSGNPTLLDPIITCSSPSFTPFEGGDFCLGRNTKLVSPLHPFNDSIPRESEDADFDPEGKDCPSIEEPPELELKDLPSHLEYAFLEGTDKLPVINSKELKEEEKAALLKVLKSHKRAIAWKISTIKGIDPSVYNHKILMEDEFNRRFNIKDG